MSYRYHAPGYERADLIQEGVLSVLSAVKNFRGEAPLEHFVRAVIQRRFTWLNRDKTRQEVGGQKGNQVFDSVADPLPTAEEDQIENEEIQAFREAVATLSKEVRDVVELRRDGYTLQQVCERLGLANRASAYRLEQEGLAQIREILSSRGLYE
jgi:RNA polymerase sigma factor (sigma-70 family)